MNIIKDETTERMQKCIDSLSNQFNKIRTGRANPSILDSIKVDYYGNQTPIIRLLILVWRKIGPL